MLHRRALATALSVLLTGFALSPTGTAPARSAPPPPSSTSEATGNAVTAWNQIAVDTLAGLPGPAGGAPSAAPVHVAMVQGAVYDAVNAIGPKRYQPYLLNRRFPAHASKDAAIATAAHGMLHYIVSTVPNLPAETRATLQDSLAAQYADSLAAIRNGWTKWKGIAAGRAAVRAMIAARHDDGRFGPSQWVPNDAPGHWSPLVDPTTGLPILDPTPWVGGVEPFVLRTSSQFRTRGPNSLSSNVWAREFNEVKDLGAANSTTRTTEQTCIARWWQSQPMVSWNEVARALIVHEGLGRTDSARVLAMQNLSAADASINCWNDKYHWDFWRPWNAIRRAAEDGNPATAPDPGWTALITAPYPEHPSGHLCLDGANTRILKKFFGNVIDGGYQITSRSTFLGPTDPKIRSFGSFSQAIDEIVEARIWAGLHYRTADLQGLGLGLKVARYTASNALQPVGHRH